MNRRMTPYQHIISSSAAVGGYPGGRRLREAESDLEVRNQGDGYEIHLISQAAHTWAHSKLHDHPDIEAEFKSGDTIRLDTSHAAEAVKLAKSAGLKVDGEVKESRRVRESPGDTIHDFRRSLESQESSGQRSLTERGARRNESRLDQSKVHNMAADIVGGMLEDLEVFNGHDVHAYAPDWPEFSGLDPADYAAIASEVQKIARQLKAKL